MFALGVFLASDLVPVTNNYYIRAEQYVIKLYLGCSFALLFSTHISNSKRSSIHASFLLVIGLVTEERACVGGFILNPLHTVCHHLWLEHGNCLAAVECFIISTSVIAGCVSIW